MATSTKQSLLSAFRAARANQKLRTSEALQGSVQPTESPVDSSTGREEQTETFKFTSSPPDGGDGDAGESADGPPRKRDGYFWTGPHRYLRNCRPYYWLPLESENLSPDNTGGIRSYEQAIGHILDGLRESREPITDVFVLSHGWHRNLYSAASAYDRLVGRFIELIASGRIQPRKKFVPLFICLQWHSDPGQNQWMDGNGRRSKLSFMEKVRDHFHAAARPNETLPQCEARFLRDFERLFEVLSRLVSTPEEKAQNVPYQQMAAAHALLDDYRLVGSPNEGSCTRADKTAVLWMCYHESTPRGRLTPQKDRTRYGYLSPVQAISVLVSFAMAIGPLVTLLLSGFSGLKGLWTKLFKSLPPQPWARWLFIGVVVCATYLYLASFWSDFKNTWKQVPQKGKAPQTGVSPAPAHPRGFSLTLVIAFLVTEVVFAIPLLLSGFASYFFGGFFARYLWRKSLSAPGHERIGMRGQAPTASDITDFRNWQSRALARGRFAQWARLPVQWLRAAVPLDGKLADVTDVLDSQLAFYEMQNRGVQCGHLAGEALQKLFDLDAERDGHLQEARFHFISHSFGTLVTTNAVRYLTYKQSQRKPHLQTHCLLQGALSSNWFDGEADILSTQKGNIANVYSHYDTATGFYYPLANYARTAAGNMGLLPVKDQTENDLQSISKPDKPLILLVSPPVLKAKPQPLNPNIATVFDLDCSHIIYQGAVATGGGHDDIFKDDVVHLIWAACDL